MRRTLLTALAVLPLAAGAQDVANKPVRVVVQVSEADPARWNLAPNNVRNLQEELGAAKGSRSRSSPTGRASRC